MRSSKITDHAQQRANFAYQQVKKAAEALGDTDTEFKAHVKKVPLMIRTNGLAATYAFVQSKAKYKTVKNQEIKDNDYAWITEISREWLKEKGVEVAMGKDKRKDMTEKQKDLNFAGGLAELKRLDYRLARKELLALFTWLKRFADGMIDKKGKEVENGKG